MSCQICVEVCPFEAIKMDKEFELSRRERFDALLMRKDDLAKSNDYYRRVSPTDAAEVDAKLAAAAEVAAKKKAAAEAAAKAAAAKATQQPPTPRHSEAALETAASTSAPSEPAVTKPPANASS